LDDKDLKKQKLKEMIQRLHRGEDPNIVKKDFEEVLNDTSATEIARIEEELVKEGMPREKLHKLCDVHIAMFKERLEEQKDIAPEGHPVHTLMEEHKILLKFAEMLKTTADEIGKGEEAFEKIQHLLDHFKESDLHYLREENVLFPYLDKHGIKEPPAIMWMEHDQIRELKKGIYRLFDGRKEMDADQLKKRLKEAAIGLAEMLSNHFFKENNILYPAAMDVISEDEWAAISKEFEDVGYCCFTPKSAKQMKPEVTSDATEMTEIEEGMIDLDTGSMTREQLEWVFKTMPVDVTFVDKDDTVRYLSSVVRSRCAIPRRASMSLIRYSKTSGTERGTRPSSGSTLAESSSTSDILRSRTERANILDVSRYPRTSPLFRR